MHRDQIVKSNRVLGCLLRSGTPCASGCQQTHPHAAHYRSLKQTQSHALSSFWDDLVGELYSATVKYYAGFFSFPTWRDRLLHLEATWP
jgi:hypothetical protein